jgi:nucleoside-diphosphate-sugar epimerase
VLPDGFYSFVDVRDVAHAHIQAFETHAANGKYCLVGSVTHHSEACKILFVDIIQKLYHPSFHLPEK